MDRFHQPPTIYVADVHLSVRDLSQSLPFYERTLGFVRLDKTPMANDDDEQSSVALSADGVTPLLTLHEIESDAEQTGTMAGDRATCGLYHVALLLPGREYLARMIRHLRDTNTIISGAADHLVSEAVYLDDPDGNGIELYCDYPTDVWRWQGEQVEMTSKPLDWRRLLAPGQVNNERATETDYRLPATTKIGHIHLRVADLHAARDYYENGLGFALTSDWQQHGAMFFGDGNYHHHIGVNIWTSRGAPAACAGEPGVLHFSVVYPDERSLVETIRRLSTAVAGYYVESTPTQTWSRDPSGNLIRFVVHESSYMEDMRGGEIIWQT